VLASQLIDGGVDSNVFEHFIRCLLERIRSQPDLMRRRIVLLMDNATIHHHHHVLATALEYRAVVLFNCPYSPFLNPVENFFKLLKTNTTLQAATSK
jgi:transposase